PSRTGALDMRGNTLRMPAGGPMARPLFLVGRIDRATAVVAERTTRRKGTTDRQIRQRWHHAGNFSQPLGGRRRRTTEIQPRDRNQETLGIGMQRRREELADSGLDRKSVV